MYKYAYFKSNQHMWLMVSDFNTESVLGKICHIRSEV